MRSVLGILTAALLLQSDAAGPRPERFTAIMTAGPLTPRPTPVDIGVDRWSTPDTRASLFDLYHADGLPALLEAVKKAGDAGYVRMANHERLVAGYVHEEPLPDGGRRILMLCPRYRGDWELSSDLGWADHVFRVVALTLDQRNRGTGMLFHTAKISFGKNGPVLVSELSGQPTRLLSIRKTR